METRSFSKLGILGGAGTAGAGAETSGPATVARGGVVRLRRQVVLARVARGLPLLTDAQQTQVARESYTYAALSLLWLLRLGALPNPQSLVALDDDTRASVDAMRTLLTNGEAPPHAIIRPATQDKKCYELLRDVLQRLNANGSAAQLVGLVADQRCNNEHARAVVTFLGQSTHFPTGAARLHLESGATLWFAAVLHNKRFYTTSDPTEKPFCLVLRP
ncbi:hypothetical protein PHYBOEH_006504, partial [Phytophthora boehmeriae]